MKLKWVIVKNFGIFRGARSFDLDDDLVMIYGENFSGKTTLGRAIYFALCGKVLTTAIKPQEIVSSNEQSATAGVVYTHENATYRIYRSTKGDLKCEYFQHQQWQQQENNDLFLPPLNPQQWQISCFLKEDELGEFLTKPPASRRDLLNQLLGIEQLLSVQDALINVRRLAKRLEKTAVSRQSSLRLDGVEDCARELAACRNTVVFLEGKLQQPEDADSRQRLYLEWKRQKDAVQIRLNALTAEYETLLSGFANHDELRNTVHQVSERLTERNQCIREAEIRTENRILLSTKLRQVEELLTNFQRLRGQEICPTCLQSLSEEHLHRLENTYREQCDELRFRLNKAETEERETRETLALFEQLASREADLRRRIEKMEFLQKDLQEARAQLETLEARLATIPLPGEDGGGSANTDVTATSNERLTWQCELDQARTRLKQLETQQAIFQEHRQNIETINRQASKATHHRLLSEWVADAVEQTLQTIVGASLKRVEENVIRCLQEFDLLRGCSRPLDLERSRLMPDINGHAFQALSGSEKVILYLGMKMAISQLMPGTDFMVLDNPTLHLDDLRREQMRDYLLRLISKKQIIILTNDKAFADSIGQGKHIELS
jgi:DNA repair exonuclease SbcCD ATPase subunit